MLSYYSGAICILRTFRTKILQINHLQKPSIVNNSNGYERNADLTGDYDENTFNAKRSPDDYNYRDSGESSNDTAFVAQPMTVTVSEPQKESEGSSGTYISYLITTHVSNIFANILHTSFVVTDNYVQTSIPTFSSRSPCRVRRRYQDFVWLYTALTYEFSASIVPPLPEKHRIGMSTHRWLHDWCKI